MPRIKIKSTVKRNPNYTERGATQRIRVLRSRWLLIDPPEADQRIELVRKRHRHTYRIGRHTVGRALRLVVLLARGGDRRVLALCQGVVLAHEPLHFREFTYHIRQ